MELKEIVTVSGKSGLFKVVKPTRTGMILESLDAQKTRFIAGTQHRMSLLSEISIYTNTAEGNTPLGEVLQNVYATYGTQELPVSGKSEPTALAGFMAEAVPDYDSERVYASDIKKLVIWYGILLQQAPEVLQKTEVAEAPAAEGETKTDSAEEETTEKKKPTKKKSASEA